jgi:YVTN family beta-propeller protein
VSTVVSPYSGFCVIPSLFDGPSPVSNSDSWQEKIMTKGLSRLVVGLVCSLIVSLPVSSTAVAATYSVGATISVGNSPFTAVITPNGTEVYISNFGSNTVSVISTATDTVTATVSVGSQPDALAVSTDGSKVYVGQNGGDVSVIDTATKTVSTISAGTPVRDLALTPDGTKLYLAMEFSGLKEVNTTTNAVTTVSNIACPEGVAVTPNGKFLYVNYQCGGPGGTSGHDAIGKFLVSKNKLIKGITGFPNVGSKIIVSPDGKRVWATDGDACINPVYDHVGCPVIPQGVVNVLSTATDKLVQSLGAPGRVGFSPSDSFVALGGPQITLLTPAIGFIGLVSLPGSGSVAVTPDGTKLYLPVPSANAVTIINVSP